MPNHSKKFADDMPDRLSGLLARARAAGADEAETACVSRRQTSLSRRHGKIERSQYAEESQIGLRVRIGRRSGGAALSGDLLQTPADEDALIARALALASAQSEDVYAGLPQNGFCRRPLPPDIADPEPADAAALAQLAAEAEETALAREFTAKGISASLGASASAASLHIARADSRGFAASWRESQHSLSLALIAGADPAAMERDYDYAVTRYYQDLPPPAALGRRAAERTLARLNPRPAPSAEVPVIFARRAASSLLHHCAAALAGPLLARNGSFLNGQRGEKVFASGISLIDDPFLPRGVRARPCDSQGAAGSKKYLVQDGVLQEYLLDAASARALKLAPTGHAIAAPGGAPSVAPSNLSLVRGSASRAGLIGAVSSGLLVTELIGQGVNLLTGDYSRGAAGFWIERGEIAWPVSGLTIAGNLKTMFLHLQPAGDAPHHPGESTGFDTPSLAAGLMTIAGSR